MDAPLATDPVHGHEARGGDWSWREPRYGEHFERCSYCGSISPADLAAEPTWRAEWADRKYGWPHKVYIDIPNRAPERLFAVGGRHEAKEGPYAPGGEYYTPPGPEWVAWGDLSPEQVAIVERDRFPDTDYVLFDTRPNHHAKFYTVHLADPGLSGEVKDAIERRCGLRFRFEGGHVRWETV